jgi:cell division initiation protein
MKITPIEIRQKDFEKVFRGYEKETVDAFLLSLSQEWERIMDENKDLRKGIDNAEKEVVRLREVENSLFRTLKTAEDAGNHLIDSANKTAELHIREAQMNAEAIMSEARSRARTILEEAEEKAKEITGNLQDEVKSLERNYNLLTDQKDNLLRDLKLLLNEFSEKIDKYSGRTDTKKAEAKFKNAKHMAIEKFKEVDHVELPMLKKEETKKNEPAPNSDAIPGDEVNESFFDKI